MTLALRYIHEKRILHRDIKPHNVFLTTMNSADAKVKIGDLGISREMSRATRMVKTFTGTHIYMSPEVIDAKLYDFKCDVWSLGCPLYEMCTFRPPFNDERILFYLCANITNQAHDPIPEIYSPALKAMVDRLLEKDQETRPTIAEILSSDTMVEQMQIHGYEPKLMFVVDQKL